MLMGAEPSVKFPDPEEEDDMSGRCLSGEICYICWQAETDKKIYSPCKCKQVVHTTCLIKYVKLGNFSCPICTELLFQSRKKKKRRKTKKLTLAIKTIQRQNKTPTPSPLGACTPTCGIGSLFTRSSG